MNATQDMTENTDELALFLRIGAGISIKAPDARAFLDWIAEAGPTLAPTLVAQVDPRSGPPSFFFRALGVAMFNALPHPDSGFIPRKILTPGRNEPCFCGSGDKYKHCCLPLAGRSIDFSQFNLLRYVLDTLPEKQWADLPRSRVDRDAVYDTARQWAEEDRNDRALALLEPWFQGDAPLSWDLEPMFDQLMDCYLVLGKERKRARLIDQVMARGDRRLRAAAIQRQATMLADAGDIDGACDAFARAQREDPDNPVHASLECVLLLSRGETARAQERARFWIARLERRRDIESDRLLDFLLRVRDQPQAALRPFDEAQVPGLDDLSRLFESVPSVQPLYDLDGAGDAGHRLVPRLELAAVEARWSEVFPSVKPMLTATQIDSDEMWQSPGAWLGFLDKNPLAWQSFDVLDDLILAVEACGDVSADATLIEPLLARGCALLQTNLRGVVDEATCTLPWGWADNRPALRILAHRACRWLDDPDQGEVSDAFIRDAEWLLSLNPMDNHGLREPLSRAYLYRGWPARTIALTGRYPEDFCGPTLNRILALYCEGRVDDAANALRCAAKPHAVAIKMLLADKPAQPKPEDGWCITVGGREEAWLYRQAMRELWQDSGGLDWLKKAWKKPAR